jgi:hypothetical protein
MMQVMLRSKEIQGTKTIFIQLFLNYRKNMKNFKFYSMLVITGVVAWLFPEASSEGVAMMAAAPLIIKPNFNKVNNQVFFATDKLNAFMRDEIRDNFSLYQKRFNVFSWMRLTKMLTYVMHNISGQPFMWQSHNSCGWDPTGSLWTGKREVTPSKAKINEENCYDELFGSCFQQFATWDGKGPVKFDSEGVKLWNDITKVLVQNATLGALVSLCVGQLYDLDSIEFSKKAPSNIKELFGKTAGVCKGWLELLKEMGLTENHGHMNIPGTFDAGDFDGGKYTGDVLDLFDGIVDGAPDELQSLIAEGGINAFDDNSQNPQLLVSTSIYNAAAVQYKTQQLANLNIDHRLTRVEESVAGKSFKVYYIDDVPLIPITYTNVYEKYLTGTTHFAYVQSNGNIALGGSFANLPEVNGGRNDSSILIAQGNGATDYGKFYFLAHQLFATQVGDTNYVAGAQVYAVNA